MAKNGSLAPIRGDHSSPSPDGKVLACGNWRRTGCYDADASQLIRPSHKHNAIAVAFCPDGTLSRETFWRDSWTSHERNSAIPSHGMVKFWLSRPTGSARIAV